MNKLLIVVDMQSDFVTGALGSEAAQAIVPAVDAKLRAAYFAGDKVVFTRDTHDENYLNTQEGKNLPVPHCVKGTSGWEIIDALKPHAEVIGDVIDKPTFGSLELAKQIDVSEYDEIELCGLCTDICVVSNALILKAQLPETKITVDARCCAGVTAESHKAALLTMKMCQVNVVGEEDNNV